MNSKNSRRQRRRLLVGTSAAAAVLAVAAVAWGLGPGRQTLRGVIYPTANYTLGVGDERLLVVGDSFTQGAKATGVEHTYPSLLSGSTPGSIRVVAEVNAGFTVPGLHGHDAADLLEIASDTGDPSMVLIAFGYNDGSATRVDLTEAAADALDQAASTWPLADLAVLGPINSGPEMRATLPPTAEALRAAASAAGACFIDGRDWLDDARYISEDGVHPNDVGYAEIAARLAPAIADC